MSAERWSPIPGMEGFYSVSSHGRVRSENRVVPRAGIISHTVRERILSAAKKASGHLSVQLHFNGGTRRLHVHRLVLLAFVGQPPAPGHEAAHNDGDASNNRLENLRWATRSENHADKVAHGTHNRGQAHPLSKLTDQQAEIIRQSTASSAALASQFGIGPKHVRAIKTGARRSY